MTERSSLVWDVAIGGAAALSVGALGWLEVIMADNLEAADLSLREFGTLLTVLSGALAALWWNQSARIPNSPDSQNHGNILNGAAATFTVLSVFCSVFASAPWKSAGSLLSAIGVLVVLAMSGSDIRQAVPITLRQRPLLREVLILVLLGAGAVSLLWHFAT